jgi:Arc/MetJ-type ribon-helix-helix transcriptional regulator
MAKLKLTVTITPEVIRWIDDQVKEGHFADRSHAVQFSLLKVKELIDKGEIKF